MKTKVLSTVVLLFMIVAANAQMGMPTSVPTTAPAAQAAVTKAETNTGASLGSLVSQFSSQVNTSALTDEFNKGKAAFENQAKTTSSTDVKANSSLLQKLAGGLKSSSFSSGWASIKDKWTANVKAATTTKQLAGYLKTLTENVNPKFLGSNWEKIKPTFNAALDKLSK